MKNLILLTLLFVGTTLSAQETFLSAHYGLPISSFQTKASSPFWETAKDQLLFIGLNWHKEFEQWAEFRVGLHYVSSRDSALLFSDRSSRFHKRIVQVYWDDILGLDIGVGAFVPLSERHRIGLACDAGVGMRSMLREHIVDFEGYVSNSDKYKFKPHLFVYNTILTSYEFAFKPQFRLFCQLGYRYSIGLKRIFEPVESSATPQHILPFDMDALRVLHFDSLYNFEKYRMFTFNIGVKYRLREWETVYVKD